MRQRYYLGFLLVFFAGLMSANTAIAQNELKIKGTYQIEKNQRHGWLILNLEIPDGCHVYALTQEGTPPPTRLKLEESDQFELLEKFKANKKPKVIENDPIFEQRIEKHEGKIAFMAPIKIAAAVELESVEFQLKMNGQLCNDSGCQLISDRKIEVEFAGFYEKEDGEKKKKKKKKGK